MDQLLINLIDDCLSIAVDQGLTPTEPILVSINHITLGSESDIIVSYSEPFSYTLPANVTWIDADPSSLNYKKAFIRIAKTPLVPFQHSWTELSLYNDVFNPPQYYEAEDLPTVNATIEDMQKHIGEQSPTDDPHNITTWVNGVTAQMNNSFRAMFNNVNQRVITNDLRIRELETLNIPETLNLMQAAINELKQVDIDYGDRITNLEQNNGGGSGIASYNHIVAEADAANLWVVTHNLDTRNGLVQVFDHTGEQVGPDKYEFFDNNILIVYFSTAVYGKLSLVKT